MNIMQIKEIERLKSDLEKKYLTAKVTGTFEYLSLNLIDAENLINILTKLCNYTRKAIDWTPIEIGYEQNSNSYDTDFFLTLDKSKRTFTLPNKHLIDYDENTISDAIADFLSEEYKIKIKNELNDLSTIIKNAQLINRLGGK